MTTTTHQLITLDRIHPSKTNPRRNFDAAALKELTASVQQNGVLQPVLVRPNGKGYELVAGERRYRAAKAAGLAELPAMVRELTDQEALEIQVIENLQRDDLHPLEEAEGYERLLKVPGYDVAKIAARIDRSEKYVYDRIKLLQLIEPIRKVFLHDEITAGHAILLARLAPSDQQRAIEKEAFGGYSTGLWQDDVSLFADDEQEHRKACSVRELEHWIQAHVRFNDQQVDAFDHPETATVLKQAVEAEEKVVHITHEHYVRPEARTNERVLGPRSWREVKGKPCAHAVTGVIVIGEGRGQALKVCIQKEKCATHWKDWQKERAQRATSVAREGGTAQERAQKEKQRREKAQAQEDAQRAHWKQALSAILEALAVAVKKAPTVASGYLASVVVAECAPNWNGLTSKKVADRYVPRGRTAEDVLRHAAFLVLAKEASNEYHGARDFPKIAKALGIDLKKILDAAAPPQTSAQGKHATTKKA